MCQLIASISIWCAETPKIRASQNRMNWRCASNSVKDEVMQTLSAQKPHELTARKSPLSKMPEGLADSESKT
jgi:predicted Fe-S protein YdhL (DUF1289 family)